MTNSSDVVVIPLVRVSVFSIGLLWLLLLENARRSLHPCQDAFFTIFQPLSARLLEPHPKPLRCDKKTCHYVDRQYQPLHTTIKKFNCWNGMLKPRPVLFHPVPIPNPHQLLRWTLDKNLRISRLLNSLWLPGHRKFRNTRQTSIDEVTSDVFNATCVQLTLERRPFLSCRHSRSY